MSNQERQDKQAQTRERAERIRAARAVNQGAAAPVFYYRWLPGRSLRAGAIVRDGQTLYGPCAVAGVFDRR